MKVEQVLFETYANVKKASTKLGPDPFLCTVLQDVYRRADFRSGKSLDLETRFRQFIINTQSPRSAIRELVLPEHAGAPAWLRNLAMSQCTNRSVYPRGFILAYQYTFIYWQLYAGAFLALPTVCESTRDAPLTNAWMVMMMDKGRKDAPSDFKIVVVYASSSLALQPLTSLRDQPKDTEESFIVIHGCNICCFDPEVSINEEPPVWYQG
ncbi:hypothetical protein N7523_005717 [Penicillium sp. IBT 18751x]|nr:hypothetical protein N7523_005717 [Penicillium sp. IBT 18751x]